MSIIGIDLGTTTSEVAYYVNGKAEIIKNIQEGDSTVIPSVVLIEDGDIKVGQIAKNQMILKPKKTVIEIKKLMGKDKNISIENKEYSPIEISAMILRKIKEIAEFYIGEEVEEAVITVPANFNDKGRRDTKKAGEMAGLKVERIINEPTAAAIAYGINNLETNMNILVYDFGGGTIDVTVLELFNGVLDVKTSRGASIGGKDIDQLLIEYIMDKFLQETGIKLDKENLRVLSALKNVSEECKKNLSFQNSWNVVVPYICVDENNDPVDLNMSISQEELGNIIEGIIKETENIVEDALMGANLEKREIDKVILVGGSTRLLQVKNMIKTKFGIDKIVTGINPEETVAIGAAIQCALKNNDIELNSNIVVADACNYTLGVEVFGHKFDPIIKRDSKLPTKVKKLYKTVEDNQDEAIINIYEGESEDVVNNEKLDTISIKDIPLGEKGKEIMEITFAYDLNGILNVDVEVLSTGIIKSKLIKDEISEEKQEEKEIENNIDNATKELVEESNTKENSEQNDEEDEDYSTVYTEVAALSEYVKDHLQEYDDDVQEFVKTLMQDLLVVVKKDDFKKCREIEHAVLRKMGIE